MVMISPSLHLPIKRHVVMIGVLLALMISFVSIEAHAEEEGVSTICFDEFTQYGMDSNDVQTQAEIIVYGCGAVRAESRLDTLLGIMKLPVEVRSDLRIPMVALIAKWGADDPRWSALRIKLQNIKSREYKRIRANPKRLLYYPIAADHHSFLVLHRLMRKVTLKSVTALSIVYAGIASREPSDSAQHWFGSSLKMLQGLKKKRLHMMMQTPASALLLTGMAPITYRDIHSVNTPSHASFLALRKEVFNEQVRIFDLIQKQTGSTIKAMQVATILKPYLISGIIESGDSRVIQTYLRHQLTAPVVVNALASATEPLDYQSLENLFSRMYAPFSAKTHKPIRYLQGNMSRIAKWYNANPDIASRMMQQDIDPDLYSTLMAFLPDMYLRLSHQQKKVFDDLLISLGGNIINNGMFVIGLYHKSDYFQWIAEDDTDAFARMQGRNGRSVPKYLYILMEPVTLQGTNAPIAQFDQGEGVDTALLMRRIQASPSQLATRSALPIIPKSTQEPSHLLGNVLDAFDFADNVFTVFGIVAAIVAAPATGGVSLAAIPALLAKKGAAKIIKKMIIKTAKKLTGQAVKAVKNAPHEVARVVKNTLKDVKSKFGRQRGNSAANKRSVTNSERKNTTKTNEKTDKDKTLLANNKNIEKFNSLGEPTHRAQLKGNMMKKRKGNGKSKKNGNGACKSKYEAHHAVPVSVGRIFMSKCPQLADPLTPYYINAAENGVCLPKNAEARGATYKGAPVHTGHTNNIKNVTTSLDDAYKEGGCSGLFKQMKCIQNQTKQATTTDVGNIRFRVCR